MTQESVVDLSALGGRRKARGHPKGRPLDPQAQAEIGALLGHCPAAALTSSSSTCIASRTVTDTFRPRTSWRSRRN